MEILSFLPKEILVALSAMIPFTEINGSIPLGQFLGLTPSSILFWSLLGNTIIGMALLKLIIPLSNFLRSHSKKIDNLIGGIFKRIEDTHFEKFRRLGTLLLFVFVAIPGPGTGTYTATIAAYLFKIRFFPAIFAIFFGNLINGLILTGGIETIKYGLQFLGAR